MKRRAWNILLSVLLSMAAFCLPVQAQEQYTVLTVQQVKALPADTQGVTFRGTVVWTEETSALVQDEGGSLWLQTTESLSPGDVVLVTGQAGQTLFLAETVVWEGVGLMPAMETELAGAQEALRIVIYGGILSEGVLTQNGCSVMVQADEIPDGKADVYGILFDGILYADTILPAPQPSREWNAYFGLLDAHSSFSDGLGSVQEAFSHASQADGLDFFAVTDHADCLDSAKWAAGKQAAAAVTGEHFVGLFGYEVGWGENDSIEHINTFATPDWHTSRQPGMDTLAEYCAALAKIPGAVSQFNHPDLYHGDFDGFRDWNPTCDAVIQLLQVEGEGGASFYPGYIQALDAGWHVAPTVGQDNHHGNWGDEGLSRTAVLAGSLSEQAVCEALAARRAYATQDPDLYIDYRLNGSLMGSIIGSTEELEAGIVLDDPTDGAEALVEVISSGGAVLASGETTDGVLSLALPGGYPYYFLRVTQPDGDAAVTAPVWVDDFEDMGIASFAAETQRPSAGQTVTLTLALYNREEVPFEVSGAALYRGSQKLGEFTAAGGLSYTFPLLWESAGEVRLTAVVWGSVNGMERSYEQDLTLHFAASAPVAAAIRQAAAGSPGGAYIIEGHAVSGNTNPYTTFPNTIYVQDDTGGIPVRGEFSQRIQIGTPLTITGVLRAEKGLRYLELTDCRIPDKAMYRYASPVLSCRDATDFALRGGTLVQTEGTVEAMTAAGAEVSRFTLRDSSGSSAVIVIDPEIRSGAYGVNTLAERIHLRDTVRVMGLLSREDSGHTVLRVRDCDEVAAVAAAAAEASAPVIADESNPPTGDRRILLLLRFFCGKWLH